MKRTPIAATFSKDPTFWGVNFYPKTIESAQGARLISSDGRSYLDWVCGLGANLLGNANPGFTAAIKEALDRGLAYSLPSELEESVAAKLALRVGSRAGMSDAMIRFGGTGSDICAAAVRLARAHTGHSHILSFGYHGTADMFIAGSPPAHGVIPEESGYIHQIEWNDVDALAAHEKRGDWAAVIVEQPPYDPSPSWYGALRRFCDHTGALLIMDEVVTGLRWGIGGATERYMARPDLICLGKALGNGLPMAALMGRPIHMNWFARNDPVFILSNTTNANNASLAAADYILSTWTDDDVDHLWLIGNALKERFASIGYTVFGHGPRFLTTFQTDHERAYFIVKMRDAGILMNRPVFPNLAHTLSDVERTALCAKIVWEEMQEMGTERIISLMDDKLPTVLFRNR